MRPAVAALLIVAALFFIVDWVGRGVAATPGKKAQQQQTSPLDSAASVAAAVRVRAVEPPTVVRHHLRHTDRPHLLLETTAYCSSGSPTASGVWPRIGMAASNLYKFGTRLSVPGFGVVTITDRSAPNATDLDLFFGSDPGCQQRATDFGRRHLLVEVLP